jgi:GTP-binding protein
MFKDRIRLNLRAGKGGDGGMFFDPMNRKADGGNGGNGGDLYLVGDTNSFDYRKLKSDHWYAAEDGEKGMEKNMFGANGKDKFVNVTLATIVYNADGELIAEITEPNQKVMLLHGGRGGLGNRFFRSGQFETREKTTPGFEGDSLEGVIFELELDSDVIFIGYPNAGKSSILRATTNADAKVAPYAFTTLEPQLGRTDNVIMMDLPGLIEGTHEGKGLGTKFVKHTRRAKYVAHFISLEEVQEDLAFEKLIQKYESMREELKNIDQDLYEKPEVIILTKSDLLEEKDREKARKFIEKKLKKETLVVSAYDFDALEELKKFFAKLIK